MFTFSKKINLGFLLKIFFFTKTRMDIFKKNNLFGNQKLILFNKSRWSLLFIIFLYKKIYKKEIINLWIPSYYCNYALSKIRNTFPEVNFVFYPINENLQANLDIIKKINKSHKANIFINVNFFGQRNENSHLINFLKSNSSWLVNDCTHCINTKVELEKYSDFSIYSPHKFYSIPSGAICKINFNGINKLDEQKYFKNIDLLKKDFLKEINLNSFKYILFDSLFNFLWFIKRFINIFYNKIKIYDFYKNPVEKKSLIENKPFPSLLAKKLIINSISLDKKINDNRDRTFLLWKIIIDMLLKEKFNYEYIFDNINNNQGNYNLIIKANKNNVEQIYNILSFHKIPVSTWPDIAPEIKFNKMFDITFELRKTYIFINLHPQIGQQLKFLKKFKFGKNLILNNLKLKNIEDEVEWNVYLSQTNYSFITLLSKYYKNDIFFKSQRFLIENNKKKIGIFQAYTLTLGKIIFVRINFGPCFFLDLKEKEKINVINFIISDLYKNKLKFLLISPNLQLNDRNLIFNRKNNLFIFSGSCWKSININLSDSIRNLKKNLKSNLRRDIIRKNRSTKFTLKKIVSQHEFDKFINNYHEQSNTKNFKGISENVLKKLFENKNLLIFNALINENVISSVCIALHGSVATYLVGYNLDKINSANDLLLWKSLVYLKKNNFKYFDLGGVDLINNRNVSLFKSNFGGNYYRLVGSKFLII